MTNHERTTPSRATMHLSFLFSGAGTLLLGSTLPVLARTWNLADAQSGLLIAAQFLGLFLGAFALWNELRRTLLCGFALAGCGFLSLAASVASTGGYLPGMLSLFVLGLGLGQITTSVNLLFAAGFESSRQRAASLSLLNFTWSAGAILVPLVAGFFLARHAVLWLLLLFPAGAVGLFIAATRAFPTHGQSMDGSQLEEPARMRLGPLSLFFALFFLYGGLEFTVGGWLSTYSLRYASLGVAAAAYSTSALWIAFAAGRAIAFAVLRVVTNGVVRGGGVALAACGAIALDRAHTGWGIALCASLIGIGLGPFFPITFSVLVAQVPRPRQAGAATAMVALGQAVFPFLLGLVSTRANSLRAAMLMPVALCLLLLGLTVLPMRAPDGARKIG